MGDLQYAQEFNTRNMYPSKGNTLRHKNYRQFFQNQQDNVVSMLPTKPEIRKLVKQRVHEIVHDRDPSFRNPVQEAGWDHRGPLHTYVRSHNKHQFRGDRRYRDDPFDQSLKPKPPAPRNSFLKKNSRCFATPTFLAGQVPAVVEVRVRRDGNKVGMIEFAFSNGETSSFGSGGEVPYEPFIVPDGDGIVSVQGARDAEGALVSIQFLTANGLASAAFGEGEGEAFQLEAGGALQVIGLVRDSTGSITALNTAALQLGEMREYSSVMKSGRRQARPREMSSIELRERAALDEYHSFWRTSKNTPRGQRRANQMAQTARSYGERRFSKPQTKKGDWDSRFHVMVSKDNKTNHSSFREYFDAPRHFVAT